MTKNIIVVDANVAVKMLHHESDSEQARAFFKFCTVEGTRLLVPEHFLYELVSVCQRVGVSVESVLDFFHALKGSILTVVTSQKETWLQAENIAQDGNKNSGFPSIYDSIYHALAIEAGGIFITADKRHFAKASQHEHITMLSEFYTSAFV